MATKFRHSTSIGKAIKASAPAFVPACVLIWASREFFGVEVPGEVGAALSSMLTASVVYLLGLLKHGAKE